MFTNIYWNLKVLQIFVDELMLLLFALKHWTCILSITTCDFEWEFSDTMIFCLLTRLTIKNVSNWWLKIWNSVKQVIVDFGWFMLNASNDQTRLKFANLCFFKYIYKNID